MSQGFKKIAHESLQPKEFAFHKKNLENISQENLKLRITLT